MALSDYLVTDDLTVVLGFIGLSVYLLKNIYKPQPLVHPILLGRQSDAARVRHPGESTVYRNYGTGLLSRFPIRPDKDVNIVNDVVRPQTESPRTLWSTKITNAQLNERVAAFGAGISRLLPGESDVLLLLNDGIEFLIADLALAKYSFKSVTLFSPQLLPCALEAHQLSAIIVGSDFLPFVLALIPDKNKHPLKIIVVGQYDKKSLPAAARQAEVEIINWPQIEADGTQGIASASTPPVPRKAYTLGFSETPTGQLLGVRFTHENMTSGMTAVRALCPPSVALSSLDVILSSHSLSTPYGRAIAYAALYECAGFATVDSAKLYSPHVTLRAGAEVLADAKYPTGNDSQTDTNREIQLKEPPHDVTDLLSATQYSIPPPTILFIDPAHLEALSNSILKDAQKSWLYPLAWRHKLASLSEGFITKDSLWDRVVFDNAREHIMGGMASTVKAVIVSGGPVSDATLTHARVALSIPVINTYVHPCATGPVFATHAFDVQVLPASDHPAHVGGPSINVEIKLKGVNDRYLEENIDPVGEILVRGPPVGDVVTGTRQEVGDEGWTETGCCGRVMTNGAFRVLGSAA